MTIRYFLIGALLFASFCSTAQLDSRISAGYNTFNEIYLGYDFPLRTKSSPTGVGIRLSGQIGYQFALSSSAVYTFGPAEMRSPFLTNNASGYRMRFGYQDFPFQSLNHLSFFLEYEGLQSNLFRYQDYSGSQFGTANEFVEQYSKYGVRFMKSVSIGGSHLFFTYSFALFYSEVKRTYSLKGSYGNTMPSTEVERFQYIVPQLTAGLKFYL